MRLDRFNWKKNKLYLGNKKTETFLEKHPRYDMFYIQTARGRTEDFYNITWAKHHATRLTTEDTRFIDVPKAL